VVVQYGPDIILIPDVPVDSYGREGPIGHLFHLQGHALIVCDEGIVHVCFRCESTVV